MKATSFSQWAGLLGSFHGTRKQVRELVDYCRVFSSEDAMRWALAAYVEASRHLAQSEGLWVEGGLPWSTPDGFADLFKQEFELRLWDACERSPRYREVRAWSDRLQREALAKSGIEVEDDAEPSADLLRPHMPSLPLCGKVVDAGSVVEGGSTP
jgi:hypothetical protein